MSHKNIALTIICSLVILSFTITACAPKATEAPTVTEALPAETEAPATEEVVPVE